MHEVDASVSTYCALNIDLSIILIGCTIGLVWRSSMVNCTYDWKHKLHLRGSLYMRSCVSKTKIKSEVFFTSLQQTSKQQK